MRAHVCVCVRMCVCAQVSVCVCECMHVWFVSCCGLVAELDLCQPLIAVIFLALSY